MKIAVIGIGSNSVRMLLADAAGGCFTRIRRDREGTRLFSGLDAEGNLSRESMRMTADAVRRMAEDARAEGAGRVSIFATSASRDAANGQEFMTLIRRETGAEPEIVSGTEEAELSFLGASGVLPGNGLRGVIDIGGGSTELICGDSASVRACVSCQLGAVRLFRAMPMNSREDLPGVREAAGRILREALGARPALTAPMPWAGTGGTFTTLAAIARRTEWTDRTYMHGYRLTREQIRETAVKLADMPVEKRLELRGLQPSRADIVVHGICILAATMDALKLEHLTVSEWGNLEGYIRKHCLRD